MAEDLVRDWAELACDIVAHIKGEGHGDYLTFK